MGGLEQKSYACTADKYSEESIIVVKGKGHAGPSSKNATEHEPTH